MKIVGFAFKNNISSEVLQNLKLKRKHFVTSEHEAIKNFVNKLITEKPDYILGLGMYSKKDKNKLRIETHYSKDIKRYSISYFLSPGKNTKLTNGIGNSYCNHISLLIMESIKNKKLNSKYTFVHIPKTFQTNKAVLEIEEMLSKLE
ncbi:hypothetical protein ACFL0F_02400 [Patescibacteria group bacterium]